MGFGPLPPGIREAQLQSFLKAISERGFRESSRSGRLYYNPEMPDVRFVTAKHVVRFEKRVEEDWRLWESYRITRELGLALQVIDAPGHTFQQSQVNAKCAAWVDPYNRQNRDGPYGLSPRKETNAAKVVHGRLPEEDGASASPLSPRVC